MAEFFSEIEDILLENGWLFETQVPGMGVFYFQLIGILAGKIMPGLGRGSKVSSVNAYGQNRFIQV